MRYNAVHSLVMLRGPKGDESLLRLRTAGSSPAVRRTVPIKGLRWPLSREDPSQADEFCWAVCHRHRVGGDRVKRPSGFGPTLSEIKRYVQRVLGHEAGKASVHAACRLTVPGYCT